MNKMIDYAHIDTSINARSEKLKTLDAAIQTIIVFAFTILACGLLLFIS